VCVLYCGRLIVPTVLRKAETRVFQQDLESLVLESNGQIGLYASLRKYVGRRQKLASSKIASKANLSKTRAWEKKDCYLSIKLVIMIDDFVVEKIFN